MTVFPWHRALALPPLLPLISRVRALSSFEKLGRPVVAERRPPRGRRALWLPIPAYTVSMPYEKRTSPCGELASHIIVRLCLAQGRLSTDDHRRPSTQKHIFSKLRICLAHGTFEFTVCGHGDDEVPRLAPAPKAPPWNLGRAAAAVRV